MSQHDWQFREASSGKAIPIISLQFANSIKFSNTSVLAAFLNDAKRFVLTNREILDIAPLQLYSSAIIFTPETSIIRDGYRICIPRWLKTLPRVRKIWSPLVQTLEGHLYPVNSLSFSPDDKVLASGSDDKTIKLWSTATEELQQTLEGYLEWISSISFSPDGKILASGAHDHTIRLWDTATEELQQTIKGHSLSIESISFSPDSKVLASGSSDNTIKL